MTSPDPASSSSTCHPQQGQTGRVQSLLGDSLLLPNPGPCWTRIPSPRCPPLLTPIAHRPAETWCLFSAAFKRASFWYIMAPSDLLALLLFSPGLASKDPPFSRRVSGLSCENSQISWGGSYPRRGGTVQRPGHNSALVLTPP